ncbi:AEC family transporter [Leeia sp. TBRC 13508]|uniref:AEC family transporter n=1 Tax=Leeia speluncae TaxID=2884804 RepID=A0ABS8D2A0_9NEIS|nr:AEC family transporter [Leeia speluncae]MCB6182098.1 AEC family transporter [Leeia speluncae]
MLLLINTLLPIFALLLIGYACRRFGCLGENASVELNRLVVWLALPALLLKVTATTPLSEIGNVGFLAALTISSGVVFIATLVYRLKKNKQLADASIDGLCASYANTGFIGIPLCMHIYGDTGVLAAILATLVVACVLFAIGIICIEVGTQTHTHWFASFKNVSQSLLKNPLVVSPFVGMFLSGFHITLPEPAMTLITLLGQAATPCALVSLGAFLAHKQRGNSRDAYLLVSAKLIIQPLITGVLVYHVFHLPPVWANSAILLSALPTGTGPFMLASHYVRDATTVSSTILQTTVGSIVSVSMCLLLFNR